MHILRITAAKDVFRFATLKICSNCVKNRLDSGMQHRKRSHTSLVFPVPLLPTRTTRSFSDAASCRSATICSYRPRTPARDNRFLVEPSDLHCEKGRIQSSLFEDQTLGAFKRLFSKRCDNCPLLVRIRKLGSEGARREKDRGTSLVKQIFCLWCLVERESIISFRPSKSCLSGEGNHRVATQMFWIWCSRYVL